MEWTDKQLKIILWVVNHADGGCCYCVQNCLKEFIERNNFDFSLLNRLESLFEKEMNSYEWNILKPVWEKWELSKRSDEN